MNLKKLAISWRLVGDFGNYVGVFKFEWSKRSIGS
jgi:hypothetical protein